MLRLPGALPALQLVGRVVEKTLGSTKFGRDLPDGLRLLQVERFRDLREHF